MSSPRSWFEILKLLFLYARLRQKKGLLGQDFMIRGLQSVAGRLLGPRRTRQDSPMIASLCLTSKCPLACEHCSEGYGDSYELPAAVIQKALDDLVDLGCPVISFTGGEPFCRKELEEFVERIPSHVLVSVYTCGLGLTREIAARLARRRNLMVCFSLDHSDPDEHDRLRGRPGLHTAVMNGMKYLAAGHVEIHVSSLVTRERLQGDELIDFARNLKKQGVACLELFQPLPVGRLAQRRDLCLRPEEEELLTGITRELNRDSQAPMVVSYPSIDHSKMLGCCGGYARLHIDSHGNVCPCDFAPMSFGKLTEESVLEIWERMRSFYTSPGTGCPARDNLEIFGIERKERNVLFSGLKDPRKLHTPQAGVYKKFGESVYRALLSSPTLATVAACYWDRPEGVE
jgi:MoaA/NifB/PqqE/SkfB family radical SAM enzyme